MPAFFLLHCDVLVYLPLFIFREHSMKRTILFFVCLMGSVHTWANSDAMKSENQKEVKEFCSNQELWQHYPNVDKKTCVHAASQCIGDQDTAAQGWRQTFFRCVFDRLDVNAAD